MTTNQLPTVSDGYDPQQLESYIPDEDGYSIPVFIRGVPRLYGDLRFRFRPVDVIERSLFVTLQSRTTEKELTSRMADAIANRITEWDASYKEADGERKPMPIDKKWLLRLKAPLILRLFNVVIWGIDGGDEDPKHSTKKVLEGFELEIDSVINKRPIQETMVEEMRKN